MRSNPPEQLDRSPAPRSLSSPTPTTTPRRWPAIWALSGAATVVLFAFGLVFGDLIGTTNYPALNASAQSLRRYFLHNHSEVRALSFFHLLAAIALLAFSACLYDRLRSRTSGPGTLALVGGSCAAALLLLSALCYRALAEPAVARDPPLAHVLVVLSYLAGGPGIGVPLVLPAGAVAAATWRERLLPSWIGWLSLLAALFGAASATTMLGPANNSSAIYGILLLAALLMFAWLIATSARACSARSWSDDGPLIKVRRRWWQRRATGVRQKCAPLAHVKIESGA